jgi:hypothetical protein
MGTTFKEGDPSFAGVLGGLALGLKSYHIFELKDEVPADVWEKEMAFEELQIEDERIEEIRRVMAEVRGD